MQPEDVHSAIAAAPLSATQALQRGLVNELCYFDQVLDRVTTPAHNSSPNAATATSISTRSDENKDRREALPTVDVGQYLISVRREKRIETHNSRPLAFIKGRGLRLKSATLLVFGGRVGVDCPCTRMHTYCWSLPTTYRPETLVNLISSAPPGPFTPTPSASPIVAIITASGKITTGRGTQDPIRKPEQITSAELCDRLRSARADPSVKAIVLRINSPGGSAVASDAIHREVEQTVRSGTPVVVSMGNVAASGGYYVASPASRILALPATLTGR